MRIDFGSFGLFWLIFGLGILLKEGICKVLIFGFMRSKSSNLDVWKIWGVDPKMGLYL